MEKPRVKGARWTNKHIAADEKVENLDIGDFDTKRDRWNGYDPDSYTKIFDMYALLPLYAYWTIHCRACQATAIDYCTAYLMCHMSKC